MSRFDLDEFIGEVRSANSEAGQSGVMAVLQRALTDNDSIIEALGEPSEVGPLPIYQSSNLTILNVVWSPLMVLLPHDHKMWATIGIYTGREDNIIWKRQSETIKAAGAASLSEGDTFSLPEDAIHSVVNPVKRMTGAIHIYGGDFFATQKSEWDPEDLTERPMDFEEKKRQFRQAQDRFDTDSR